MFNRLFTGANLLIMSVVIAGAALFIFTPTGLTEPPADKAMLIHFADNISAAHLKFINRFSETYRGRLEAVPVNLPLRQSNEPSHT
jgi:hypothetical protein